MIFCQNLDKFHADFAQVFGIDQDGNAWCWGGGSLGFKDVIFRIKLEIF
jgi:hypothetical protein